MSQRFAHGGTGSRQTSNKGFAKSQKVFVPKNQAQNQTPTLSNSLRQSLSHHSDSAAPIKVRAGDGNFVNYLPQDEAVAAGLGANEGGLDPVESQRVVDLLNRELSRLLKLSPKEFWREVASDASLHEFLDSFLQFRARWYDFPHHGAKEMVAGVIVGELELSRRVFMVLYRISSNRDPGARAADSLSPKDHGVLLQEKKLLDLPKLLDICAIYGHENEDLTSFLVRNALSAQPRIHEYLTSVVSQFLSIVHTMHERCGSSLQALFSSGNLGDHGSSRLYADMLEVMDFINDAIVSMDAFVSAYKPAAMFFSFPVEIRDGNEELLCTLAKLHDSLLPSLQRGFQIILTSGEDGMVSNIRLGLNLLAMRISKFGWNLLEFGYLSDGAFGDNLPIPVATKMFPANIEDPGIRADLLIQTFREISAVSISTQENHNRKTFLQNIEKNFHLMSKLESLRNVGWIFMDDEQLEFVSSIFMHSEKSTGKELVNMPTPVTSGKAEIDEDAAIMESKISQIRELFPDYGQGFLAACLEAYNQNPEEVIQRILEGTLHQDLQALDISLEVMPTSKTASTVGRNDKGKGKLVESVSVSSNNSVAGGRVQQSERPSVSSSSSVGRFVRKSKGDVPDSNTLDDKNEKDSARTAALLSQYEYEDEYDDSFDDLGLSVAESRFEENEILGDKIRSGKSWENESESSSQNPSDSSKWGSRKKPQYYVKDGKNYSYKVEGSVAVANAGEASLVTLAQKELIYGLGRGGNLPLGAVKQLMEATEDQDKQQQAVSETEERRFGNQRGRGRRGGGRGRQRESNAEQDKQFGASEGEGGESGGNYRGRRGGGGGRQRDSNEEQDKQSGAAEGKGGENAGNYRGRGERRGGGRNHNRKDRAVAKHFSRLGGY